MIKRIMPVLISAVLLLSGCNPFTTNLYSSFDKYKMPSLTNAGDLLKAKNDSKFYETLKDNPEDKAIVLNTLTTVMNDTNASMEDRQNAAVMAADVHLKTSDTEEIMESLNSVVADAADGKEVYDPDQGGQPEVFFRTLLGEPPAGVAKATYKAQVLVQLKAFLAAAEPLEKYGETREAGAPIPPDINPGDTATKALMAGYTRTIVYYLDKDDQTTSLDKLADWMATPKDAGGNLPPALVYKTTPPKFDKPTDAIKNPKTQSTGLFTVVNDGLDVDKLMK